MASSEPSSLALAQEVLGYSMKTLSQEDVDLLKRLVLDWCGVVAKGTSTPWGQKLNTWAEANAGGGKAIIAGSGIKRAAASAALVNGTIAHGYELDDTHDASMSHPGAVVISAAMAVAGQIGAKGEDVLPAIAAGYEVMARVGMAANALETLTFG
ncbi:MAG: MmgE/PrpD family protein, partial [Alphaproteobacteria bacterium]